LLMIISLITSNLQPPHPHPLPQGEREKVREINLEGSLP
jgi:hypothetical protein